MSLPTHARMFTGRLDVAPFACLFFLLVIFLVLLTHLAPVPGVTVSLPEARLTEVAVGPDWLVVVMDDGGRLYFSQQLVSPDRLREELRRQLTTPEAPRRLVLQASAEVELQKLVSFYALCREAGVEEVKLQTRSPVFEARGSAMAP